MSSQRMCTPVAPPHIFSAHAVLQSADMTAMKALSSDSINNILTGAFCSWGPKCKLCSLWEPQARRA